MCPCSFTSRNKYGAHVGNIESRRSSGDRQTWKSLYLPLNFAVHLKRLLKSEICFQKNGFKFFLYSSYTEGRPLSLESGQTCHCFYQLSMAPKASSGKAMQLLPGWRTTLARGCFLGGPSLPSGEAIGGTVVAGSHSAHLAWVDLNPSPNVEVLVPSACAQDLA